MFLVMAYAAQITAQSARVRVQQQPVQIQVKPQLMQLDTNAIKRTTIPRTTKYKIYRVDNNVVQPIEATLNNLELNEGENQKLLYVGNNLSPARTTLKLPEAEKKMPPKSLGIYYISRMKDNSVSFLKPIIYLDRKMKYNADKQVFEGEVAVILEDTLNPGSSTELIDPVTIEVMSDADEIAPRTIKIKHTNLPFEKIQLSEENPLEDNLPFRLVTQANLDGYKASLGIEPRLIIRKNGQVSRLLGWGLEEREIHLSVLGLASKETVEVSLNVSSGGLSQSKVLLKAGKEASVKVRSAGTGSATLAVESIYGNDQMDFYYILPWWFVILAAIGSLLAGFVRWKTKKKTHEEPLWSYLVTASIGGMVLAAAYNLGFTKLIEKAFGGLVPMYAFTNEALVFVVAFLGGLGGVSFKGLFEKKEEG